MSGLLSNDAPDKGEVKPSTSKTPDDLADYLSQDDDKTDKPVKDKVDKEDKPAKDKDVDKDDKDDKLDDLDKDDIELKEDEDEDEDEKLKLEKEDKEDKDKIEIDAPPKKKEILAKYPNFYKDFPFFEKMMFRDRQYTELFGSFDDAKEVADRAETLERFETDLLKGNTETILTQIKSSDKKAFDKIVDGYLPTLAKVDKEAYYEVVGNIGKHIVKELVAEARNVTTTNKEQGEQLQQVALLLNQFLFGTSTWTPPKPRVEKTDAAADEELETERREFAQERFTTFRNELQTKIDNTLKATISDYIDPKGEMTAYVKKNAIKDALDSLHKGIGGDTAFRKSLDRLWESAFSDKFSQASGQRIRSTYLGKSKQLLPTIIKKARAEALKDLTPTSRKEKDDEDKDDDKETTSRRREPITSGRPRQSGGKNKMEKGESVLDFLSRD